MLGPGTAPLNVHAGKRTPGATSISRLAISTRYSRRTRPPGSLVTVPVSNSVSVRIACSRAASPGDGGSSAFDVGAARIAPAKTARRRRRATEDLAVLEHQHPAHSRVGAAGVGELSGAGHGHVDLADLAGKKLALARHVEAHDAEVVSHQGALVVPDDEMDPLPGPELDSRVVPVERVVAHAHDDRARRARGRTGKPARDDGRGGGESEDRDERNESAFHWGLHGTEKLDMPKYALRYAGRQAGNCRARPGGPSVSSSSEHPCRP